MNDCFRVSAVLFAFIFLGCAGVQKDTKPILLPNPFPEGKKGCFLLYNMKTEKFDSVLGDSCSERYPACSSFKVPLAVMAFDSGVLPDENFVLKWNGKKDVREESNQDHNAKTWMRDSVLWFSQRITPRLGPKKFQKYLDEFDYGNRNFSEGITTAWVTAPNSKVEGLKITAYEQVNFMKKLWTDALPVSPRAMKLTREITSLETSPNGFTLNGKTGSHFYDKERKMQFGWFIAHLQKGSDEYIVVTNLSDLRPFDEKGYGGPKAKQLTKQILNGQGLW